MVLRKKPCAKYQSCLNETVNEMVRYEKACSPVSKENLLRVAEDDSVDESYRVVLLSLLACQEDDLIECKERLVVHEKRKEIVDVSDDAELQCDPQYVQFLRHLKTHDKSYVLEFEEDDGSLVIEKYEEDVGGSDEEGDLEEVPMSKVELNRTLNVVHETILDKPEVRLLARGCKRKCGPSDEVCGVEIQHKPAKMGITDWMENVDGQCNAKHGDNFSFRGEKINHQRRENGRLLPSALKLKSGNSNQMPVRENQRVSNKTMSPTREKSRKVAEREKIQHKPDNLHNKIGNTDKVECIGGPWKRQTRENLPVKSRVGIPSQIRRVESQEYTWKGKSPTCEKSRKETKRDDRNVRLGNDRHVYMHKNQAGKINHQKQGEVGNLPRKPKTEIPDQMSGSENQHYKSPTREKSRKETKRDDRNVRLGNDPHVRMHKNQAGQINHQKQGKARNLPREPKTEIPDQMSGLENQHYTLAKQTDSPIRGKSRNETNMEVNHVRMHNGHRMGFENISEKNGRKKQPGRDLHGKRKQNAELPNEMHRLKNCRGFYSKHALAKNTKSSTPERLMNEATKVKTENCSGEEHMAYEKYESDSEVEILDEAAWLRKEISNPIVPAKRLNNSIEEAPIVALGGSRLNDVFRKEVLDVLKKPYDEEEYTRLRQAVRDGGYLRYHPEIAKKLKFHKYRYNRRRRLTIFRGFFFWLQNSSREGSFRPWKDGECLAVEPPYRRA